MVGHVRRRFHRSLLRIEPRLRSDERSRDLSSRGSAAPPPAHRERLLAAANATNCITHAPRLASRRACPIGACRVTTRSWTRLPWGTVTTRPVNPLPVPDADVRIVVAATSKLFISVVATTSTVTGHAVPGACFDHVDGTGSAQSHCIQEFVCRES